MSVETLAEKLGKNRATIYRYESDQIENMPLSVIEPLAKVLNVSPAYLMGWEDLILDIDPSDTILIPIVGRISCGNGVWAYEEIEGYEPTPREWVKDGDYFYLRAKGDSMTGARIHDGDLLLIKSNLI